MLINKMDRMFGKGKVIKKNGKLVYRGSFPKVNTNDEIVILPANVLEEIIKSDENALLITGIKMDEYLFDNSQLNELNGSESPPFFEDELDYIDKDIKYKLYLDRHLYSKNPKDMIWIRYVNIDESLIEEWDKLIKP